MSPSGDRRHLTGTSSALSSPSTARATPQNRRTPPPEHTSSLGLLTLGALGVVYGDIGTSPLYSLRECFHGQHGVAATHDNVLGVLSLIFWSLTLIISVKYILFVMRADNNGEGGILALLALVAQGPDATRKSRAMLIALGLFGAALLYGDGMITPAISVLSAVEGLEVVTHIFEPYIVPITLIILVVLFMIQSRGTTRVGMLFGPVMVVWFATIAVLGVSWVVREPRVLAAFNPLHGMTFFQANGWHGFVVLGAVFLVVTGGEALYADMGHFGRKPIRLAWFSIVLPALFLNYLGQGAMILLDPTKAASPFYFMAPRWGLLPLVVLATAAAIIASQALISGAFSLTRQAIQLGYSPRLEISYTSAHHQGQIYVPQVNWALMFATLGLVVGFQSSSALAAAYGIAVSLTMLITTMLAYLVARGAWGVRRLVAGSIALFFFLIECAFFGANLTKVAHGGWFPLVVGIIVYTVLSTWKAGRALLAQRMRERLYPFDRFLQDIEMYPPQRVSGTAIFMTSNLQGTPPTLLHNLQHNKVLHDRVVLLTVTTSDVPHVSANDRATVDSLGHGFYRLTLRYGFMEEPDVPDALGEASVRGFPMDLNETTFFLGIETLLATRRPGLPLWRERLFVLIARNAMRANAFFKIPPERVVELGMQVEL
jgi:KUP system potassium uptake protein